MSKSIPQRGCNGGSIRKIPALEAEKVILSKSGFPGMSHELRSPLNAILGFAQLLATGTPPLTVSQMTSVDQILRAGWGLLELINEILDLALAESDRSKASPADPPLGPTSPDPQQGLRTILYVEDNLANLQLVEALLGRRPNLSLLTATEALSGIALARAQQPDVILMDINLPGITGIQALAVLRADPLTARIPVVALSANAIATDVERGLAAGFFQYITKPIDFRTFLASVDAALERSEKPLP